MANPQGEPIWYELMCRDMATTSRFYEAVLGWQITGSDMGGVPDYRFIKHGSGEYDMVGGAMQLTAVMLSGGARPMWAVYFCVEDVDAAVQRVTANGGRILMPAFDIENVGRMAFVTDPQGNPFYVMRGFSDMDSDVFAADASGTGRCGWNELITPELESALGFYREVFGYDTGERMNMGPEMGDYVFLKAGDKTIGAAMNAMPGSSPCWRFYFRVADIDTAHAAVETNGGTIVFGPEDVPGDEVILMAHDPEGTIFGLLAARKG